MLGYRLRRPIHSSWMVACCCIGIILGVSLARDVPPFISIAWLLTGLVLCAATMLRGKAWLVPVAVAGGLLIGVWRGSVVYEGIKAYDSVIGETVTLSGSVSDDADTNKRGQLVLRLKDIRINGHALPGAVWITTSDKTTVRRSDIVTVNGKISDGFGSFAGSIYSAKLLAVQRPTPGDVALEARDYFARGVQAALPQTEASLGLGYLVGQRRGLPPELDTALQAAGLTHIVVASGYNLTILVRIARRLFEKISKYVSLIASSLMIVCFIAVTGLSPSMSRAGLVAGLSLLAWYYGRRFHPLVLLPFAMAVTLIAQPSYAWGDLGWQLSFAAFGGVMIVAPLIQAYFFGDKPENALRRIFIETIAATITTLPILLASFGQFSLVGPIANMAILPLVPVAMLATFVAGVGGLFLPALATFIGMPAQITLTYMTSMTRFMGAVPWALQEVTLSFGLAVWAYLIIAAACLYMRYKTNYSLRTSSLIE